MRKLPKKSTKLYGLLSDPLPREYRSVCQSGTGGKCTDPDCEQCWPDTPLPKRYMVVRLRFDREAFDSLKELLREKIALPSNRHVRTTDSATPVTSALAREEPIIGRLTREALKRVFDQIRDMKYSDV